MRYKPFAAAAIFPLVAALVTGCTTDNPGQFAGGASASDVEATSSPADPCLVVAEAPGLPAWEVNEALPIDGVDVVHNQAELLVERGGGSCVSEMVAAVVDPCRLVSGPYEQVEGIHLWRHADAFLEQEVAAGARRILSENFDGSTVDGEEFHWRAVAIEYDDPGDAEMSPGWVEIEACEELKSDELQTGLVSLSEGSEPFLAATIDGSTVYVVETWLASDGGDHLDDTGTGLPPADAVRMLMAWLKDQMRDL